MTLRAQPPAKLNLTLAVGPRGDDGFHPLRSVFVRIGLADELTVDLGTALEADRLTVSGLPDCPIEGNLVLRAMALLRGAVGQSLPPLQAYLEKRIPLAAGLAGGSSDGASALALAAEAWGIGLSPELAAEIQAALGSDVPFFARGGAVALVEGRGEQVTPLPRLGTPAGVLLATSNMALASAAVYARYDDLRLGPATPAEQATDELVAALRDGLDGAGLVDFAPRLREANELWHAAVSLAPELVRRRAGLESATGRPWLLTGSGRTLFALYPSAGEAEADRGRLVDAASGVPSDVSLIATRLAAEP